MMDSVTTIVKKERTFLLFLFFFSLVVRAATFGLLLSKDERYMDFDSLKYNEVAQQIYQGQGISNADGTNHFYRVPGYALFLSILYKMFGNHPVNALWVQVFLASFIPILIFFLSLVLFPSNMSVAKISSVYASFHFGYVILSGFLMTESLFCIFFLLFLILFFSKKYFFLSGVFLGLASMLRPVGHYFMLVLFVICLFNLNFPIKAGKIRVIYKKSYICLFILLLEN